MTQNLKTHLSNMTFIFNTYIARNKNRERIETKKII